MSTVYLRRSDETVARLLAAAFPGYKGTRISARVSATVRFTGTNWDEGSKRDYVIVRLADMQVAGVQEAPYFLGSPLHQDTFTIPDGFVVAVLVHFRGQEYLEIITPTANITPALERAPVLAPDEKIVLLATTGRKASYAGQGNYRFQEARRLTGITQERYAAAKANLIARKLLNRAGAITPEGRNAAGSETLDNLRTNRQLGGSAPATQDV